MNKLFAETLSILNGFAAFTTIAICAYIGQQILPPYLSLYRLTYWGQPISSETIGLFIGFLIGFGWAVLVNGQLALFIQMYRELKAIRQQLRDTRRFRAPTSNSQLTIAELVGRRV